VDVLAYATGLKYLIPPLRYIPLDFCILLAIMDREAYVGTNTWMGRGKSTTTLSRSIISISSHHRHASLEIQLAI